MRTIKMTWCAVAMLAVAVLSQDAQAQRPAHYYPARPTFSTFLLYRQINATGIPNYYSYVRPATQYRDFLARSQPSANRGRQTLSMEQEVTRILENQLRQRVTTGIGQVNIPAQFNETGHFYPRPPATRRR